MKTGQELFTPEEQAVIWGLGLVAYIRALQAGRTQYPTPKAPAPRKPKAKRQHWTQRPENRARVVATMRKAWRAKRKAARKAGTA